METIRGKTSHNLDWNGFKDRMTNYNRITLDLGTGDGRYVHHLAFRHPDWFVVGLDACRENLREHSRAKLPNLLFVIAPAQELPTEFEGIFSQVTINFPWGSLLDSLLEGDPALMNGLRSVVRPDAQIEVHLNGGALTEAGASLEVGAEQIRKNASQYGWVLKSPFPMDHRVLREFPTTWAKRIAYGRDPRALSLSGKRVQ